MVGRDLHGTNPEQLFAAGYAACFIGALTRAFANAGKSIPSDVAIDSDVSLLPKGEVFTVSVVLNVSLPGVDRDEAQRFLDAAHQICPYSNATRGNIDVQLNVV
jgi:Ohr subfamily peroxiredoxin